MVLRQEEIGNIFIIGGAIQRPMRIDILFFFLPSAGPASLRVELRQRVYSHGLEVAGQDRFGLYHSQRRYKVVPKPRLLNLEA